MFRFYPLFSVIFRFRLDAEVKKAQKTAVGAWRSLVAHHTGGVGVVGSNPIAPTNDSNYLFSIFIVLKILLNLTLNLGFPNHIFLTTIISRFFWIHACPMSS